MNLKQVLMNLGNRLVTERGFDPAVFDNPDRKSTVPIRVFTEWLNHTPEAIEILKEMGINWPVVKLK